MGAAPDPNFLVIGAARSGTTTLHHCLGEHPEIYVPAEKRPEPHFFYKEAEYARGLEAYRQRTFGASRGETAIGETSTSTLFGPSCASRIAAHYPRMRLVCMLRNPVDRAYSSYWHSVRNGLEELGFEEAIEHEAERFARLEGEEREIAACAYVGRGLYGPQLERYLEHFPSEQIHVLLFEEFVREPATVLADLFRFLGVSAEIEIHEARSIHNRSTPRDRPLPPALRQRLSEAFRASNEQLAGILGRDLSLWDT